MGQGQRVTSLIALGDSLIAVGKASKALEQFEKAVDLESSARTYTARARALYPMDRMDRFLLDVEKALKLDSTYAEAHYLRALYSLRSSDPVGAEVHCTTAIRMANDSLLRAKSHMLRGEARAEQLKNEDAIRDLEIGTRKVRDDIPAMRTLAALYDGAGRYTDALVVLERLCELEPYDIGHWTNRSFELIQLERYSEAMSMVERALVMDKDEPVALSNRAYIHLKQGNDKEALSDVERSIRSYPSNPYALRTRALLRLNKGEREKACNDLTLAQLLGSIPEVDRLVQEHCSSSPAQRGK
jgi:tetratricopeptide (TPR) repeat protein